MKKNLQNQNLGNKLLGQNFLVDKNILQLIFQKIDVENKNVVEIGPGFGNLTEIIVKKNPKNLLLIEKDKRFLEYLEKNFPQAKILHEDCLKCNLNSEILISNLPFCITNNFLMLLFEKISFEKCYLMLQKEVVDKIISKPGEKNFGYLSMIFQIAFNVKILIKISPNSFVPKPKIYSKFIEIIPNGKNFSIEEKKNFIKISKLIFKNKNKKFKNIIPNISEKFADLRANDLTVDDFLRVFNCPMNV